MVEVVPPPTPTPPPRLTFSTERLGGQFSLHVKAEAVIGLQEEDESRRTSDKSETLTARWPKRRDVQNKYLSTSQPPHHRPPPLTPPHAGTNCLLLDN